MSGTSAGDGGAGDAGAAKSMLERNEPEELEQVNALYSLLENRYKKRVSGLP